MKLKNLLPLLLALMMVFALVACGDDARNDDGGDDGKKEPTSMSSNPTGPTDDTGGDVGPEKPLPTTGNDNPTSPPVDGDSDDVAPDDDKDDEAPVVLTDGIVGKWECVMILDAEDMELEGFDGELVYALDFIFRADGTFTLAEDVETITESVKQFEADLVQYTVDLFYAKYEAAGMTRMDADEAMMASFGMSVLEYCRVEVAKQDLAGSVIEGLDEMNEAGTYKIEGDRLAMRDGGGKTVLYTFAMPSKDRMELDSDDAKFVELMSKLGEERMYLSRVQ